MALGMLSAIVTASLYAWGRGRLRHKLRKAGGVALTASLTLLPMATEAAVSLLACSTVSMKATAVKTLDGGADIPTSTNRGAQSIIQ